MKLELRFNNKAPVIIDDVERFIITIDGREYEVRHGRLGVNVAEALLTIRGETPIHEGLVVIPGATNLIHIGRTPLETK